jgi:hypothetical protein
MLHTSSLSCSSLWRALLLVLTAGFAACGGQSPFGRDTFPPPPIVGEPAVEPGDTVFLWIGAWQDAYVSCDYVTDCQDAGRNFGTDFYLAVADNGFSIKRTYVQFALPAVPAGTVIEEAYFEIYHDARNEDGKTDDVVIPVAEVPEAWDSNTITFANQPFQVAPTGRLNLYLRSQDWSGSENINGSVAAHFANPATNYGFAVFWPRAWQPGITKGFNSKNHLKRPLARTAQGYAPAVGGMTYGPRLLLRLVLPESASPADIVPPPTNPNDEYFNPLSARFPDPPSMIVETGTTWPAEWDVAATVGRP